MKKTVLLPLLTIVAAAAVLLGASFGLNGIAEAKAQAEHVEIMKILLPDSTDFVVEPYSGEDTSIRSVHKADNGYVIETVTYGYAGEITMLIGVSNKGTVTGLVVREMSETFGLGANALNDHVFLSQFLNTEGGVAIDTGSSDAFSSSTGTDGASGATGDAAADTDVSVYVDAISGATVTSKAIARCVNSAVAYVTGADAGSAATSWGG